MRGTIFFLVIAVLTLAFLFNLVRSRRLREKYVALWMLVGLMIIVLALFPNLLAWLARLVGVVVPANLLFALAILLLLGVCLQLSLEISRTEEKTRTLAEHVAILNLQVRSLQAAKHGQHQIGRGIPSPTKTAGERVEDYPDEQPAGT